MSVRVLRLGDSHTVGLALYGQMASTLGSDFEWVGSQTTGDAPHEGHVGWPIRLIADNWNSYFSANNPGITTLLIGTNDLAADNSAASVDASLQSLEALARRIASSSKLVLVTVPPYPAKAEFQGQYNDGVRQLAKRLAGEGLPVVLADTGPLISAADLGGDQLHLTPDGIRKEVAAIDDAILLANQSTLRRWAPVLIVGSALAAIGYWLYKDYLQ